MSLFRRWLPFVVVGAVCGWLASTSTGTGDYPADAGPAVHALAHGHISLFLSLHPAMGPFAILVQAPLAALGGSGELAEYRWASFSCLLAVGLLGLYLAFLARRRGASRLAQFLIAALCLVNPLTFEALYTGHPEELLTAALAVAAVVVASEGQGLRAAVLLGFAVASKQWALIAVLPTLMALPGRRVQAALIAGAVATLLILPGLIAAPASFLGAQGNAASTGGIVDPWNIWYPFAAIETLAVGPAHLISHVHRAPPLVGNWSHPLIVLAAIALPLALAFRRRRVALSGVDALALLALLALIRCALDPVGNLYYHEPLFLALVGWDALESRGLPLRGLAGTAVAALFWRWSHDLSDPAALNAGYIALAIPTGAAISVFLFRRGSRRQTPVAAVSEAGLGAGNSAGRSYGSTIEMGDGFGVMHP